MKTMNNIITNQELQNITGGIVIPLGPNGTCTKEQADAWWKWYNSIFPKIPIL